jgi:hypothetical protein
VADGRRIEPIRLAPTRQAFLVPEGARRGALRSRLFSPAGTTPDSAETRELGLSLARLQIDGEYVDLADDAALGAGWHAAETENGAFARRWTRGEVDLPAGARLLVVDLAEQGVYWRASRDGVAARSA